MPDLPNNLKGYDLVEHVLSPDNLILDPNNPRLQTGNHGFGRVDYDDVENEQVQKRVAAAINSEEHEVARLIASIRLRGYVNIDSIFVKKLNSSGRYLVLEGNKRTAAVKQILRDSRSELTPEILKSLENLPVKELICRDADLEQEMTDFILAIRHLGGVKDWGPMQKAHSIYTTYTRELFRSGKVEKFKYDSQIAKSTAAALNQKDKHVKNDLAVYRVFEQLRDAKFLVKSDHYSLLEMVVSRPTMAKRYFGINSSTFAISDAGMDRFNRLCIRADGPIRNPQQMRSLFYIFKNGRERDLKVIELGTETLESVEKRLKQQAKSAEFETELDAILDKIHALVVAKYTGSENEVWLIKKIKSVVNEKLYPLVGDQDTSS